MAENPTTNTDQAKPSATGGDVPSTYWMLTPNYEPGWTSIMVPKAGKLWVLYKPTGQPAEQILVRHQNGSTTVIVIGENTIPVGEYDAINYELGADPIQLWFQML